jgi:hypothetical protein
MRMLPHILLFVFGFAIIPLAPFAQEPGIPPAQRRALTPEEIEAQKAIEEAATQACTVCGGGIVTIIGLFVIFAIINIVLMIWVARDAKNRGMDSSALWMFLVMITSFVGLFIYLFARPQGDLAQCPHCRGKRLSVSATCPHCRHA